MICYSDKLNDSVLFEHDVTMQEIEKRERKRYKRKPEMGFQRFINGYVPLIGTPFVVYFISKGGRQQISEPYFRRAAKSPDDSIAVYAFEFRKHQQRVKSFVKLFHADSGGKMNNSVRIAFRDTYPPTQIIIETTVRF